MLNHTMSATTLKEIFESKKVVTGILVNIVMNTMINYTIRLHNRSCRRWSNVIFWGRTFFFPKSKVFPFLGLLG